MKICQSVLTGLLLFCSASVAGGISKADELESLLRQSLEEQFRSSTGLGFDQFNCSIPGDATGIRELTCQAVDEEGDRFFYRVIFPDNGADPTVTTAQPVSQLNATGLAAIEQPCLKFLDAFARRDWDAAHGELSQGLRVNLTRQRLESVLAPLQQVLGRMNSVNAELYSTPEPGLHVLEYALDTEAGDGVARFRLEFDEDERPWIGAFLITSEPGSELQGKLLSQTGRQVLSELIGVNVVQMEAPLEQLELIGDAVEGKVWLENGDEFSIRVYQHGSAHDLNGNDYRFQVLDAPWLIQSYLVSNGEEPLEINCPMRVAPDGGRVDCSVTFNDGSARTITLMRQGGDHRLLE